MNLTVTTTPGPGDTTTVTVAGEVDLDTAPHLRQALTSTTTAHVHVDLTGVPFMDSTGLGVLIAAHKRALDRSGTLVVLCDDDRILRLFRLTGLDTVLTIAAAA